MDTAQDNLTAEADLNRLVDQYAQEHNALWKRILDTNRDHRLFATGEQISIDYDEEEDTLLVWSGEPVAATTESVDGFMHVRVLPETLEIVSMEFLGFRARLHEPGYTPDRLYQSLDRIINQYGPGTHRITAGDAPTVAAAAREAVFAAHHVSHSG